MGKGENPNETHHDGHGSAVLGSGFADDGANETDPNDAANHETNDAVNNTANDKANGAVNYAANNKANDGHNFRQRRQEGGAGKDRTEYELSLPRHRERPGVVRGLEMPGPGKETLHGREGEGLGQEDGGKERGTPGLGRNYHLEIGFARRNFVVPAE